MEIKIQPTVPADRDWVVRFLDREAGSSRQARMGDLFDAAEHEGFIATANGERVGLATYVISGDSCELTTLYVNPRRSGTGTALLDAVARRARAAGCRRLWLITTNDNLDAMRFYQRRGLTLSAAYPGAVAEARRILKPTIPATGNFGITIRDELELGMEL